MPSEARFKKKVLRISTSLYGRVVFKIHLPTLILICLWTSANESPVIRKTFMCCAGRSVTWRPTGFNAIPGRDVWNRPLDDQSDPRDVAQYVQTQFVYMS